ncbi:MAG: sigma 54-interacting transcriptional regulator [Thermodesulfovibrionales bacterium]
MKNRDKTKKQCINDSAGLRQDSEALEAEEIERTKIEEALKVSEIRYRRLFETAQDGILLLDAETGQILDVNPFLLTMLGYSHKDFMGKKLWEIGPFSDIAASRLSFSELQSKGYVRYEHLPLEARDGHLIDVEFVSNVYLVDQEKIIQCNIRDITLRKQAEAELLRQSEVLEAARRIKENEGQLLVAVLQALPVGVAIVDIRGGIIQSNIAYDRIWGEPRPAVRSVEDYAAYKAWWADTGKPVAPDEWASAIAVQKGDATVGQVIRIQRFDGSDAFVINSASPVRDARRNIVGCAVAIQDITELRRIEDELQKAHDVLDQRVQERTQELVIANQQLLLEIAERKASEEMLRQALAEVKELKSQLREENLYLREEIGLIHSHHDIVGNSEAIRTVMLQIEQVAPTGSTVLIQGETGTGKELIAHAIHNLSGRKGRLMIKVNCAALPPTLIESELFGREKGAYTGALSKQAGRFELADASTIFLDEIDALPLDLQAKLLRVLESGEFERLGNPHTVKVDVRIISATNRDLAGAVSEGKFREDLFYRLNVFQVIVPPLRERREDILPLVWSFVKDFSKRMGKRIESIPQKCVEALQAYPWPGNVRELKNIIERAMIITSGPLLHVDVPKTANSKTDQFRTLEEAEKKHIIEALNTTGWRVSGKDGAAEILGINPKTLGSRMQKLGIQRNKKNA